MPLICYDESINMSPARLAKVDLVNGVILEYVQAGYELTLRQVYYQMVARGYIPNNLREYQNLASLVNDARLAGLIDWEHIVDVTREANTASHWNSPRDILRAAHASFALDKWKNQTYRVELWIEKDAALSIVSGVCRELDITYFSCRGYTGQAAMWGAAQRIYRYIQAGQIPVILHLGDHDPSGIDMSRDIEGRLSMFIRYHMQEEQLAPHWYDGQPIIFERHALNFDQVQLYQPPPNPTKLTDSRAKGYIEHFGHECYELDALRPQVVEQIIRDAIDPYLEEEKRQQVEEQEARDKAILLAMTRNYHAIAARYGQGE